MLSGVKWQQSHSVFPVNFAASFQVQLCRQTLKPLYRRGEVPQLADVAT